MPFFRIHLGDDSRRPAIHFAEFSTLLHYIFYNCFCTMLHIGLTQQHLKCKHTPRIGGLRKLVSFWIWNLGRRRRKQLKLLTQCEAKKCFFFRLWIVKYIWSVYNLTKKYSLEVWTKWLWYSNWWFLLEIAPLFIGNQSVDFNLFNSEDMNK